jgi:hypothetical protein
VVDQPVSRSGSEDVLVPCKGTNTARVTCHGS